MIACLSSHTSTTSIHRLALSLTQTGETKISDLTLPSDYKFPSPDQHPGLIALKKLVPAYKACSRPHTMYTRNYVYKQHSPQKCQRLVSKLHNNLTYVICRVSASMYLFARAIKNIFFLPGSLTFPRASSDISVRKCAIIGKVHGQLPGANCKSRLPLPRKFCLERP